MLIAENGNRPSFINAANPKFAEELYEYFKCEIAKKVKKMECGIFGAHMKVCLCNDGPVTIEMEY